MRACWGQHSQGWVCYSYSYRTFYHPQNRDPLRQFSLYLLHRICKEEKTAVLMITHNEQWLTTYPGIEFLCKEKKIIENIREEAECPEEVTTIQDEQQ